MSTATATDTRAEETARIDTILDGAESALNWGKRDEAYHLLRFVELIDDAVPSAMTVEQGKRWSGLADRHALGN